MTDHKRTYSQRGDDYLLEAQRVCGEDKRGQDKPTPRCPYCGGEMEIDTFENYLGWCGQAVCKACKSRAALKRHYMQQGEAEQAAYEAAMQRWQEPNAPLTLRELIEYSKNPINAPIWYEYRGLSEVGCWINVEVVRDNYCDCSEDGYGKQWRFWPHKPTLGEMEATPWEEEYAKD